MKQLHLEKADFSLEVIGGIAVNCIVEERGCWGLVTLELRVSSFVIR